MGKGSKTPPPPKPPPPVVSSNPAGDAESDAYRRKADAAGLNYEDTILGGALGKKRDDLLGSSAS